MQKFGAAFRRCSSVTCLNFYHPHHCGYNSTNFHSRCLRLLGSKSGHKDLVQKTMITIPPICSDLHALTSHTSASKRTNPKTEELSTREREVGLCAKGEADQPKTYRDSFDALSWNDSKDIIYTSVPPSKRQLKNPTISMLSRLEMKAHQTASTKVSLSSNPLIQGTVDVDTSEIPPEGLGKIKAPEFNVTTIAANICSKALQRGFPMHFSRVTYSTQAFSCGGSGNYCYVNPLVVRETEKNSLSDGSTPLHGLESKRNASTIGLTKSTSSGTGDVSSRFGLMDCDSYKQSVKEAARLRAELNSATENTKSCKEKPKSSDDQKAESKSLDSCSCTLSKSQSSKAAKSDNGKKVISLKTATNKNDFQKLKQNEVSGQEKKADKRQKDQKKHGSDKQTRKEESCHDKKKTREKKTDPCNPKEKNDPFHLEKEDPSKLKKEDGSCKSKVEMKSGPCKPKKKADPCKLRENREDFSDSKRKGDPCKSKQKKPEQKADPCRTKKKHEDPSDSKKNQKSDMKDKCNPPEKKPHENSKCHSKDSCKTMKENESSKCTKSESDLKPCTSKSKKEKSGLKSQCCLKKLDLISESTPNESDSKPKCALENSSKCKCGPKSADVKSKCAPKKSDSRPKCAPKEKDSMKSKSICSKGDKYRSRKPKCKGSASGDANYKCNPCKNGDKCDKVGGIGDMSKKCFSTSAINDIISPSKRIFSTVFIFSSSFRSRRKSFSSTINKDKKMKRKEPNANCGKLQQKPKKRKDIKKRTKPQNCYDETYEECGFKLCKEPNCADGKGVDPKSKGIGKCSNKGRK